MKMAENPKFNEYKAQIIEILAKMFDYLALDGDFKVEEKGQRIGVAIASENAGRIIGRKGQTLESLQLLLNRMMFKMDEECPHITLDIDGYASGDRENRSDDAPAADGEAPREYHRRPRHGKGGDAPRVSKEQLEKQAQDAAKEVKRWGDPVKLPEMNAHDRRIIHITLKDDPEVTTESIGEGAMKKVVISLKESAQ
ncbi:MAG: KH domain-containing protein [Lentisphaerae bacterium]|nr:KH domain-containing protein [Lentisphaerota bacterium]